MVDCPEPWKYKQDLIAKYGLELSDDESETTGTEPEDLSGLDQKTDVSDEKEEGELSDSDAEPSVSIARAAKTNGLTSPAGSSISRNQKTLSRMSDRSESESSKSGRRKTESKRRSKSRSRSRRSRTRESSSRRRYSRERVPYRSSRSDRDSNRTSNYRSERDRSDRKDTSNDRRSDNQRSYRSYDGNRKSYPDIASRDVSNRRERSSNYTEIKRSRVQTTQSKRPERYSPLSRQEILGQPDRELEEVLRQFHYYDSLTNNPFRYHTDSNNRPFSRINEIPSLQDESGDYQSEHPKNLPEGPGQPGSHLVYSSLSPVFLSSISSASVSPEGNKSIREEESNEMSTNSVGKLKSGIKSPNFIPPKHFDPKSFTIPKKRTAQVSPCTPTTPRSRDAGRVYPKNRESRPETKLNLKKSRQDVVAKDPETKPVVLETVKQALSNKSIVMTKITDMTHLVTGSSSKKPAASSETEKPTAKRNRSPLKKRDGAELCAATSALLDACLTPNRSQQNEGLQIGQKRQVGRNSDSDNARKIARGLSLMSSGESTDSSLSTDTNNSEFESLYEQFHQWDREGLELKFKAAFEKRKVLAVIPNKTELSQSHIGTIYARAEFSTRLHCSWTFLFLLASEDFKEVFNVFHSFLQRTADKLCCDLYKSDWEVLNDIRSFLNKFENNHPDSSEIYKKVEYFKMVIEDHFVDEKMTE